jgi:predicted lipoprotein with Yx(FWY)xxD motif
MMRLVKPAVPTLALTLSTLLAACGNGPMERGSGATAPDPPDPTGVGVSAPLVSVAVNPGLGARVLVDPRGRTLYHLAGEAPGRLRCKSLSCLELWHPLTAGRGGGALGSIGSLGTVTRPGGLRQVTYKGMPLYTFDQDRAPGQAKGQGVQDIGRWLAVTADDGRLAGTAPVPLM